MSRYDYFVSDSSLRTTLDGRNLDELKKLLALLPGVKMKAPRKSEVVEALERFLLGDAVVGLWKRLGTLDQSAVAEAVHSDNGTFDPGAFHAKYGALPAFHTEEKDRWSSSPTLLSLLLHPNGASGRPVPDNLREKLRSFVPAPAPTQLRTLEQIPERAPREWTSRRFRWRKGHQRL